MTHIEKKRSVARRYPTYGELLDAFMNTDGRRWELEEWLDAVGPRIRSLRVKNDCLQSEIKRLQWELKRERVKQM